MQDSTATGNVVQGNYIGINAGGTAALPNTERRGGIADLQRRQRQHDRRGSRRGGQRHLRQHRQRRSASPARRQRQRRSGQLHRHRSDGHVRIGNGGTASTSSARSARSSAARARPRNVISGNDTGIADQDRRHGHRGPGQLHRHQRRRHGGHRQRRRHRRSTAAPRQHDRRVTRPGPATSSPATPARGQRHERCRTATSSRATSIGLDAGGSLDLGNTGDGINLNGVSGTTVGGIAAGARNVISGNNNVGLRITGAAATGNVVRGNFIGINAAGSAAVGQHEQRHHHPDQRTGNTIGGTAAGEATSSPATLCTGIFVQPRRTRTWIQGNLIGLNAAGTQALGTARRHPSQRCVEHHHRRYDGGRRNVISGNTTGIQLQTGATGTLIQGNRIGTNATGRRQSRTARASTSAPRTATRLAARSRAPAINLRQHRQRHLDQRRGQQRRPGQPDRAWAPTAIVPCRTASACS